MTAMDGGNANRLSGTTFAIHVGIKKPLVYQWPFDVICMVLVYDKETKGHCARFQWKQTIAGRTASGLM